MDMLNLNRTAGPDEEDPLVKYLREVQAKKNPTDNAEYQKAMGDSYRQQNFMNDMIEGITKGGAQMGTLGGKAAQATYQKPQDPRIMDMQQQGIENDAEAKKQQLYASLAGKISERNAKKDELLASQNFQRELKQQQNDFQSAQNDLTRENNKMIWQGKALERADDKEAKTLAIQDKINERKEREAKPSDKQIEAFTDLDNAKSDLSNILAQLGKNSGWTGPVDGRIPDMLVGNDQVAWRTAVGKYKDAYRKAITGAGAGPSEIAILESRLPTASDTYDNFVAKTKEAEKELARRKATLADNLTKGGKDVSKFKDEQTQMSSSPSSGGDTVKMQAPDGSVRMVPKDQVQAAIKAGGRLFDAPSMAGR